MVTMLHSDDPEMTTPSIQAKSSVFFPIHKEPFYERVKLLSETFLPSSQWASVVLLGSHLYCAFFSVFLSLGRALYSLFRFPGSDANLWLNRPGFCGILILLLTVLTEMVKMILYRLPMLCSVRVRLWQVMFVLVYPLLVLCTICRRA